MCLDIVAINTEQSSMTKLEVSLVKIWTTKSLHCDFLLATTLSASLGDRINKQFCSLKKDAVFFYFFISRFVLTGRSWRFPYQSVNVSHGDEGGNQHSSMIFPFFHSSFPIGVTPEWAKPRQPAHFSKWFTLQLKMFFFCCLALTKLTGNYKACAYISLSEFPHVFNGGCLNGKWCEYSSGVMHECFDVWAI